MKRSSPVTEFTLWRNEQLFQVDLACYTLSHHSFPRHFHDHYVIELVLNGVDSFYCDGKNYSAGTGSLVLINPGEVHTGNTVSDIPLQYFSLYPDKEALLGIAAKLEISLPDEFRFEHSLLHQPALTHKLCRLFHAVQHNEDPICQQELFFDCMHDLLSPYCSGRLAISCKAVPTDTRIGLVTEFMRSHYSEPISLTQLAELVCLDPCYLVRLFKKATGLSPYGYLLVLRTEQARQLLRKGYRVEEAAVEAGFYDSPHLNRVFYKLTGTSPKSFRLSKSQYRTSLGSG